MNETPTDDALIDQLHAALAAADPVPADVLAVAKASFTWRTVDAELAELAFDSATEELAGVRSHDAARQLTFDAPGVQVELMVHGTGDERRLTGQLVPPQAATVELRSGSETLHATAADDGAFTFPAVPAGPVSIRCSLAAGGTLATDWLVL